MIIYVCAAFDRKVNAFMAPQFFRTKGEATRAWMDAVGAEGSLFRKHAEDFGFYYLGSFDDNDGLFVNAVHGPEPLMSALDCVVIEGKSN